MEHLRKSLRQLQMNNQRSQQEQQRQPGQQPQYVQQQHGYLPTPQPQDSSSQSHILASNRGVPLPPTTSSKPAFPQMTYAPPPFSQPSQQPLLWSEGNLLASTRSRLLAPASISAQPCQSQNSPYVAQSSPRPSERSPPHMQTVRPSVMRIQQAGSPRIRKILCLDGGGVRGLSSLMIVKHLMERLGTERGGKLEPWQEFDMIGGTSTGGLIAIMLGRLRMTVDDCIDAYINLSMDIFDPVHSQYNVAGRAIAKFQAEGKFSSQALEAQLKQMLVHLGYPENEPFRDDSQDAPKVFVTAVQAINTESVAFRTYKNPESWDPVYEKCEIWQAARATSAASTFFDPIKIGNIRYIDGGLQDNNPVFKADEESRAMFGEHSDRLIISIGTGEAPGPNFVGNALKLVEALTKLVTSCKKDDERFQRAHGGMIEDNRFYRFNVSQGLAEVGLEEWRALEQIEASTNAYLGTDTVRRSFKKCAAIMHDAGQRLGYIAGQELQNHLQVQELSATFWEFCEDCHKGVHYGKPLFSCMETRCLMFLCTDCHSGHNTAHLRHIIRLEAVQWVPALPKDLPNTRPCQHCARDSRSRMECEQCEISICGKCFGGLDVRIAFFKEHHEAYPTHRQFRYFLPPFHIKKSHWEEDPCRCTEVESALAFHCDKCHHYITTSTSFNWCRTCMTDFGCDINLCQSCHEEEVEHRSAHDFGTFDVVVDPTTTIDDFEEAVKQMIWCRYCQQGKYWLHQHSRLSLNLTPPMLEYMRRYNYQRCNRRVSGTNPKDPDDEIPGWQCNYCAQKMAFEPLGGQQRSSVCLQCMDKFCIECTALKRCGHRHPLFALPIRRPPGTAFGLVNCSICWTPYVLAQFSGLWCSDCTKYFCCGSCFDKLRQSRGREPIGRLSHAGCNFRAGYVLYLNK